ncbi:MAG: hypothetical protein AB8C46_19400 [Burkholderiaceae bacterium]
MSSANKRSVQAVTESTYVFGEHKHLLGTLTWPDEQTQGGTSIGCVLMCAGVIHRIGPHRMNVKLARALASMGIASVRVDLAAVGDSRPPATDNAYDQQAVTDLRASIDLLHEKASVKTAIMAGLCSGAVYSLMTALTDPRVTGLYMIDGYAYPTQRSKRERYLQRVREISPGVLTRSLKARLARQKPPVSEAAPDYGLSHPPIEETAGRLNQLLDRGVCISQLYSGSILQHYNYEGQFEEAFAKYPGLERIQTEFAPHINHTMTAVAAQREMMEKVMAWAQACQR